MACVVVLSACGNDAPPAQEPDPAPSSAQTTITDVRQQGVVQAEQCRRPAPTGAYDRRHENLRFSRGVAAADVTEPGGRPTCVQFAKWGNANPSIPLDSMMFSYKGVGKAPVGTDGIIIEIPVAAMVASRAPIGSVTVVINGTTYSAPTCPITFTSLSSRGGGGTFNCLAAKTPGNPFAPTDDTTDPNGPDPVAPPTPPTPVTGWFSLTP